MTAHGGQMMSAGDLSKPRRTMVRAEPDRCLTAAALVLPALGVAAWPDLIAAPMLAGPLIAFTAGAAGWATARLLHQAWPACANDNTPRVGSPVRRHATNATQAPGATTMVGAKIRTERRGTGGMSVIGADVTATGSIVTTGNLHVDGAVEGRGAAATPVVETAATLRGDAGHRTLRIENGGPVDGRMTHLPAEGRAADDAPLRVVDSSTD